MSEGYPVKIYKELDLSRSSLVLGWSEDIGNLGRKATDYLNRKLKGQEFAEIEPEDIEALADVPAETQPEAVKIVKKQPTAFARKVVARQISVEVPSRAAEVKVSDERIEKLKAQAEAHDRRMAKIDADPRVKEVQRLYRSSTVLFGLQGEIENAFCPVCGEDGTEKLRFLCHPKLTIDDAYDMTMKKHKQLRAEKEGHG